MRKHVHLTRSLAVLNYKRQLERDSFPRLQMGFIVALTGGVGLFVSFLLLQSGMGSMAVRYPFALAVSYVAFLLLLWAWLRAKEGDFTDIPDLSNAMPNLNGGGDSVSFQSGSGGDFGGGGASGSFDAPNSQSLVEIDSLSSADKSSSIVDGVDIDVGEAAIPIVAILFAIGMAVASLYVVYLAPTLFAELLVDGVLSYTLYRHLHKVETHFWLSTAFKRTVLPFLLTAIFLSIMGAVMAHYAPGARSIGEVIHYSGEKKHD